MTISPIPSPDDVSDTVKIVGSILGLFVLASPVANQWFEKWLRRKQPTEDIKKIEIENDEAQARAMSATLEAANKAIENYNAVLTRLSFLEEQSAKQTKEIQVLNQQDQEKSHQIQILLADKQKLALENADLTERVDILEETLRNHDIVVPEKKKK